MDLHGVSRGSTLVDDCLDGNADYDAMVNHGRHFHVCYVGRDDVRDDAAIGNTDCHDLRASSGETRGGGTTFCSYWCFRSWIPAYLGGILFNSYHRELVTTHLWFNVVDDGQCRTPDRRDFSYCRWVVSVDTA